MLLSPGHSPRYLTYSPSPSPTPSADKTLAVGPSSPAAATPPPASRKRQPTVLDEDTYVASIEKIIERDFFPDIPKLRDRLEWLEAVRSRDPVIIRDAQLKILERRAGKTPSTGAAARCRTETPASFLRASPPSVAPFGSPQIPPHSSTDQLGDCGEEGGVVDASLSLDEFFWRYTSEDNESFSRIIERVNRRKREKFAHYFERDGEEPAMKALEMQRTAQITDGYGTSGQPLSTLESWKYTAKNLLMYNPADGREEAPLTVDERAERAKGLTKEVVHLNTHFHSKSMSNSNQSTEAESGGILYAPIPGTTPGSWPITDRDAEKSKKYDLEELRKTPNPFFMESNKKSDNGYSFVRTPSPAPGVDESPFITWGEIEGTPLLLDPTESPFCSGGSAGGSQFRIPLPPARDVKAHSLSRQAARNLRERQKMFQKPPLPSPVRGGSMSPNIRTLSPAAQKFMRNAFAKSSRSVDETLRASYRGGSPLMNTPKTRAGSSRFSREGSLGSRSPSARHGSTPPW